MSRVSESFIDQSIRYLSGQTIGNQFFSSLSEFDFRNRSNFDRSERQMLNDFLTYMIIDHFVSVTVVETILTVILSFMYAVLRQRSLGK